MHPKLTQIHLLQPMNTSLKKSLTALYSLYLHLANIPTEKKYHNKVKSSQIKSNQVKSIQSLKSSQIASQNLKKKS